MTKFLIGIFLAVLISVGSYFIFRGGGQLENIMQNATNTPVVFEEFKQKDIYDSFAGDWISFGISSESKASISGAVGGKITLGWSNLPKGTNYINIFRRSSDGNTWIKWKIITASGGQSGSLQVDAGYKYAIQAVSEDGDILWSSQANTVVVASNPTTPTPSTPPAESNPVENPLINPIVPPSPPPSQQTTSGDPVYNIQGQIIGYQQLQTANFWVHYVNKEIELGWQNLPYTTNKLVIDRSKNSINWLQLFEQKNPKIDADFIRLIDETFTEGHYYKFNAYNDDELIATYGPLYLAPYGN